MSDYERKAGFVPGNLRLFLRRMTSPRWGWKGVLPDAVVILKGYFIWQSHIVQPTSAELRLIKGFPACKSEDNEKDWKPDLLLDGSPGWTHEKRHVVNLGTETFVVTRDMFYVEP